MKKIYTLLAAAVLAVSAQAEPYSHSAFVTTSDANAQETAALDMFMDINPKGMVIEAKDLPAADLSEIDAIWIHIDRVGLGIGNLPADFTPEVIDAIKAYHQRGGGLYLSKQATQLVSKIGRVDEIFAPNQYSDGDGGDGTDVWAVNAQLGFITTCDWCVEYANKDQYSDQRQHPIYKDLRTMQWNHVLAGKAVQCEVFALEGTGDGSPMWREDHNCMWNLNGPVYSEDNTGRNNMEKFQNATHSKVLGTWGHVVDFALGAIIEFLPLEKAATMAEGDAEPVYYTGTIIANGANGYEINPRNGGNAYADNTKNLTRNTLFYLAPLSDASGVTDIETEDADAPIQYFNLQGIECAGELPAGIYIRRCGNTVSKVAVK